MESVISAPVRLQDAAAFGLDRTRLRRGDWQMVSRGLYAPTTVARDGVGNATLLAPVLPRDSGFGHLTSAVLRGWWMPHLLGPHVAFATTRSRVHVKRKGLYVRRSEYAESSWWTASR